MKIFVSLCFWMIALTSFSIAQDTHLGLGVGTGKFPIEEDIDPNVNITFGLPFSFSSHFTYLNETNTGFTLKLHYMESQAQGNNWLTNDTINGFVNSTTFYAMFSKKWIQQNIQLGLDVGFGYSLENYLLQPETFPKRSNYINFLIGYHATYSFNEHMTFRIEPNIIVTDFVKGLNYLTGNWSGQTVGEDVAFIINFVAIFSIK